MKRIGNISPKVETADNIRLAEDNYARGKHKRHKVVRYERNLEDNLSSLLVSLTNGTWKPEPYQDKVIVEHGKTRKLCIYPAAEHVAEWAYVQLLENPLTDTYIRNSCSCVQGRGQNDFVRQVYHDLWNDYDGTYYYVQLDAHHFFPNIDHGILKTLLERKVKDKKTLAFLFQTIDNYPNGIVLGTKLSQIEGNFYLARFDHKAMRLFDIMDDPDALAYWRRRYVTDCICTVRTPWQKAEIDKGVASLGQKFDRLCREWLRDHYVYRFADNILFLSSDKTFLHLVVEMATSELWHSYRVEVNKSWNVRPVEPDGIDICGYVLFHDHVAVRKRDKKALCRQVARLRKRGDTPEQIRVKAASRIGWTVHADARNLIRTLNVNMEYVRLGKTMKARRHFIPFAGMEYEQKESVTELLCYNDRDEQSRMILLEDFIIADSKSKPGTKSLWLRYKHVESMTPVAGKDGKPVLDKDGNPVVDYAFGKDEHYCCTSSATLIDQASNDIPKDILPQPTAIHVVKNKRGGEYYKFT